MTSIIRTRLAFAFLISVLFVSARSANAQTLTIQSASANAALTVLSISGTNYCAAPVVTLSGTALSVQTATPTLITATLPSLTPGTYYLVVSCGTLAGRTVYFDVSIGAATGARTAAAGGCWAPSQRYADCGNGTVTDAVTGLIWLANAACPALGTADFAGANVAARGLHDGQCGLSDGSVASEWRLPTRDEWVATLTGRGLIKTYEPAKCVNPVLRANDGIACFAAVTQGPGAGQHAFANVVSGGYWSSSTYELDPAYAYLADLSVADLSSDSATAPHFLGNSLSLNIWPVRGGSK